MHEMILLKLDIQIPRGEVEALSRRCRTNKTRFRKGKNIFLAVARNLQVQNDVEAEIREEKRRSNGRKLGDEARRRRCGAYGKLRHNARTCQIDLQAF
jgi:hypothetical protein